MRDDETRRAMTLPHPDSPAPSWAWNILRSRIMGALAPHWGALLALALFLIVGLAVLDDYGITNDEPLHRNVALATLRHIQGERYALPPDKSFHSFYGAAFQLPLALAERVFSLQDARGVYLARHLLTHLFFLMGGLFAYLLASRLFGARLLALVAMLAFLLHPRLYGHSFYNGQDIPFLAAFVAALFLAQRAFRRDTLLAFALLGVGVGVAVNLRIMGVVLLAAIPALRALDLAFASSRRERERALLSTGAFALSSLLTVYALLPYLWADPLARAAEGWATLSAPLPPVSELFRGTLYSHVDLPAEYIPVWFSITSAPFALLLGLVGAALILFRAVKAPLEALRNTRLRFGLLLEGCFALPILAVIFLSRNVYNDWRHLYFLWGPFALLAAWGLHGLAATLSARRRRAMVFVAATAGLAATLASMALIHPNQQTFFNFSVDRVAPERLRSQYAMEYWRHPTLQALEWLSDNANLLPDMARAITGNANWETNANAAFLPDAARARLAETTSFTFVRAVPWESWSRSDRALHRVQVYGNTMLTIERKDDLQAVYAATQGREPDAGAGAYDAYRVDGAVAIVMEPCAPAFIESVGATLRVSPADPDDLPPWREGKREEPRGFHLAEYGAFFNGECVASLPLPDYPIADLRLVFGPELLDPGAARATMRRANEEGRPRARSAYDLYMANRELVYIQEQCDPLDTEQPFRLSVFPQRIDDLPEEWRERAHQRFWFDFHQRGALLEEEGACVLLFPLPDYPIAAIRTAQYAEGGGDLWEAAFSANPERYAAAYRAVAGREPRASGAFDLHLLDGDLVYVKEPCAQADTDARFFLHIVPERTGDLPEERRESGFDNLDFRFFLNGAWFDAQCAARVPLPDYPVASIRTGQYVSGAGEVWSAEFAPPRR